MMAKMKYSEIPRDLSSDSVAAFRLAQGSPERLDKWNKRHSVEGRGSPESSVCSSSIDSSPPVRLFQPSAPTRRSAFRSHCLGSRKESPEPPHENHRDDNTRHHHKSGDAVTEQHHRTCRRGTSPAPAASHIHHHSLPRSAASKSSSLPASARSGGLSAMLCVDGAALERQERISPVVESIVHVAPDSVAAQLTLMVFPMFQRIQPEELTSCGWSKNNKLDVAPNVVAMTRHFNHVSFWVVQEVLNPLQVRQRAEVVSHFIRIAKKLHELNNLHTLMAVISALRSAPIFRLQKTWAAVPKKDVQLLERLGELFSDHNNSEKLRQHMDTLRLPCVPYLALFLSDVNFIDVAHPHHGGLESQKRQLQMNNLLRILAHYQQSDYSFLPVRDHIMEYLRSARYIEELQKLLEDDQYRLSVRLEPPTPPNSTKDTTNDNVKSATLNHHISPSRKAGGSVRKPAGAFADGTVKFVPGHTKSRSLGTKLRSASLPRSAFRQPWSTAPIVATDPSIFRNGNKDGDYQASAVGGVSGAGGVWRNSSVLANHGFDSTLRNLIDDSVQEESTQSPLTSTSSSGAAMNSSSPRRSLELVETVCGHNDNNSAEGSTPSLSDSPLPPPPIRCCCIQGCVRKKAVLKDGRRPAVSSWQRYWIQLSASNLLFYQAKHLRGSDRSDFRRRPFKALSITNWTVQRHKSTRHPDSILLNNPVKGDCYKLRIVCPDAIEDWLNLLTLAVEAPAEHSDPENNLMSFE